MSSGCSARNTSSGGGLVEFVKLDTAKVADREPPRPVDENILGLNVAVRSDPAKIGQLGVGSGDEVVGGCCAQWRYPWRIMCARPLTR